MSETPIPIPVVPARPGSQPSEIDGAELDILQLPSGMNTYVAPPLPEPEQVEGLTQAKASLGELLGLLQRYRQIGQAGAVDLRHLDDANRELVDQVLGEGEVSLVLAGDNQTRIQESVLAGVWRIRVEDAEEGRLLEDRVEVAAIPRLVNETTFQVASDKVRMDAETIPEGVLNAPPLLAEINDQLDDPGDTPYVINLTLLPQTEQDLAFLSERLGQGPVTILSRGYGNCRITSTATQHVWWVQYFNSQDRDILNTLEITRVPAAACAAPEDIHDSAERLAEILEIYQ